MQCFLFDKRYKKYEVKKYNIECILKAKLTEQYLYKENLHYNLSNNSTKTPAEIPGISERISIILLSPKNTVITGFFGFQLS
jgi:hypothetical protein